jgi:hypothetical protein
LPLIGVPEIVTDTTTTQRWSRRRFMSGGVSVAALGSFVAACGGADQSASAPASGTSASPASGITPSPGSTATTTNGVDAELISRRYEELKPFAPAPAPRSTCSRSSPRGDGPIYLS